MGMEFGEAFSRSKTFLKKRVRAPQRVGGQPALAFAVHPVIVRAQPRTAARGKVLFDSLGRPVSVRNAPSVRRLKKRRR